MRRSFTAFRPLFTLALCYVGIGLILRIVFTLAPAQADAGFASLFWTLPAGAVADVVQSLYLLAPLAIYLWLMPANKRQSRAGRMLLLAGSFVWLAAMVFVGAVEYFFFDEFDSRFNIVAVDYLMYPTEVIGDIRNSYPVAPVVLAACAIAAVVVYALRSRLSSDGVNTDTFAERSRAFAMFAGLLLLALLTFDTGMLARSNNRVVDEIAINGASSFFRALRTSELDFHAFYETRDPKANFQRLTRQLATGGGTFTRLGEGRLDRRFEPRADGLGKLNVVIVMDESFGAEFSKLHGSAHDWTPSFDRYAQQGLWFANAYSSGTRTVRGLEAITCSFPPAPAESIVRRPGNENVATIGKVLREAGYSTSFLYGGYGYFDNMNAFFQGNGYEIVDRKQMRNIRFANVWGVSDEDLFDAALVHFDDLARRGKPFLGQIMTTSNHKPFTFRKGVPGVPENGGGREAGVRYADFAIGYFLDQARRHPWFDDTLFIVVADHGARVYGKVEIPLKTYEIPLMMWSPKHLQPRRIDALTGQIDIAPTLLGLLGIGYTAPFFGQDVLNAPSASPIALFNHNQDVALYRDGRMVVLGLQKRSTTYAYDRARNEFKVLPTDRALEDLTIAYYQTAAELYARKKYQ
jgi:phosphoglycerol transferase MdoB-like AlkP superfamily enzyme